MHLAQLSLKCYFRNKGREEIKVGPQETLKGCLEFRWHFSDLTMLHFTFYNRPTFFAPHWEKKIACLKPYAIHLTSEKNGFCLCLCSKFWGRTLWLSPCRSNQLPPVLIKSQWANKKSPSLWWGAAKRRFREQTK